MMNEGKIVEHGTHEELMRLDREYASMVKSGIVVAAEDNLSTYVYYIQYKIYLICWKISHYLFIFIQRKSYGDDAKK